MLQNDLMGESFYKISNPNDHEELKKNLTYEYDETPKSGTSVSKCLYSLYTTVDFLILRHSMLLLTRLLFLSQAKNVYWFKLMNGTRNVY